MGRTAEEVTNTWTDGEQRWVDGALWLASDNELIAGTRQAIRFTASIDKGVRLRFDKEFYVWDQTPAGANYVVLCASDGMPVSLISEFDHAARKGDRVELLMDYS